MSEMRHYRDVQLEPDRSLRRWTLIKRCTAAFYNTESFRDTGWHRCGLAVVPGSDRCWRHGGHRWHLNKTIIQWRRWIARLIAPRRGKS